MVALVKYFKIKCILTSMCLLIRDFTKVFYTMDYIFIVQVCQINLDLCFQQIYIDLSALFQLALKVSKKGTV